MVAIATIVTQSIRAGLVALLVSPCLACVPVEESAPTPKKKAAASDAGAGGGAAAPDNYPASATCTVVPQAGCAEGHTCTVAKLDGATICVAAGAAPLAAPCRAHGDCAVGLVCFYGSCHAPCASAADCKGTASACLQVQRGGKDVPGELSCALPCNPADPDNQLGVEGLVACAPGATCLPLPGDLGPAGSTECVPTGGADLGKACEATLDCKPGLVCLTDLQGGTSCRRFCTMGKGGCACSSFAEPQHAAIGGEIVEVGYCP